MNGITTREKALLVGAAVILVSTFYFVARIQPQMAQLKALTEEITGLEQTLANSVLPRSSADPEAVKTQLDEAKAQLKQSQEKLASLLTRRVNENSNQALEGLMLEILTLASSQGVSIDTSGVYTGSPADFGIAAAEELTRLKDGNEPFRFRPLRNLSLRGDYPHIQRFIKALPELKHDVSVLRFSIKADSDNGREQKKTAPPKGLRAELVLAL
jgi:hypothetical protein